MRGGTENAEFLRLRRPLVEVADPSRGVRVGLVRLLADEAHRAVDVRPICGSGAAGGRGVDGDSGGAWWWTGRR